MNCGQLERRRNGFFADKKYDLCIDCTLSIIGWIEKGI